MKNVTVALLVLFLTAACHHDWTRLRIPNALTYPMIMAGLALNFIASLIPMIWKTPAPAWLGAVGATNSFFGLLCGFCAMVIVFSLTGRGAGDVKLAAAIGTLTGPLLMFSILVWTHMLAGCFVLIGVIFAIGPITLCRNIFRAPVHKVFPQWCLPPQWHSQPLFTRSVPMAGFFALGTLVSLGGHLV